MADTNEGRVAVGPDGTEYTYKGGKFLDANGQEYAAPSTPSTSFTEDVKAGAVPWAARGVESTLGMIGDVTELAGRGLSGASNYIPAFAGGNYVQKAGNALQDSWVAKNLGSQFFEGYGDPLVEKMGYNPDYQPETRGGGFVRTGLQFAPAVAASIPFGPEATAIALTRGAGATVASEGLGQLAEAGTAPNSPESAVARTAGALIGHHIAPRAVTPFPADVGRVKAADQLAQDLKPYGGRVDAAQRTGSPTLRSLTGDAPDNDQAVTQMLLNKGGVTPQAGQSIVDAAHDAAKAANKNIEAAKKTATMIRDSGGPNTFAADRQRIANEARSSLPAGSKKLAEFEDALSRVQADPLGKKNTTPTQPARPGQLTGTNYFKLKNEFLSSDNKHVKALGAALEAAGHRTAGAPWKALDERAADAMRIESASRDLGPFEKNIDPKAIVNATDTNGRPVRVGSPMSEAAQNATHVLAPISGKTSNISKLALPAISATAAALMSPAAHAPTMAILGGMLGTEGMPLVTQMRTALLRSRPAQSYLGNQKFLPNRDYVGPRKNLLQRAVGVAGPSDAFFRESDKEADR